MTNPAIVATALQGITGSVLAWGMGRTAHGMAFGIRLRPDLECAPEVSAASRRFRLRVVSTTVLACLPSALFPMVGPLIGALSVVLAVSFYFWESRALRSFAAPDTGGPLEVTLDLGPDPLPPVWWLGFASLLIPALAALFVASRWDQIPDRFPTHWGLNGSADRWSTKSLEGVFRAPVFFAAITMWFQAMALVVWRGTRRNSPWRIVTVNVLAISTWAMALLGAMVTLLPLGEPSKSFVFLFILMILGTIVYALRQNPMPQGPVDTPASAWKAGLFYFNREDAALFVEKRVGLGLSLNFGHPWSWALLGLPLLLPLFVVLSAMTD